MNNITQRQRWFPVSSQLVIWLLFVSAGAVTAQAEAPADGFSTVFSVPPFQVGEFALEANGWSAVGPLADPKNEHQHSKWAPVIAEMPGDGSKTALVVPSHGIIKSTAGKLQGRVRITAVVQIGLYASANLCLSPLFGKRALLDYGYDSKSNSKEKGFYYKISGMPTLGIEGQDPKTIVPQEDIIPWEPYTLVLEVDLESDTFEVRVTGKRSDGTPLDAVVKDIPIPVLADSHIERNVSGVRLVGSDDVENPGIFLESLEVRAAP